MSTNPPKISKVSAWFKRRTAGRRIMQWISYTMIFTILVVFILERPVSPSDWRFFGTVLLLAALLVLNILWDQAHDQVHASRHRVAYAWGFNIVTDALVLAAIALTGGFEIIFLIFMQIAQFATLVGVWPGGAIYSAINLAAVLGLVAWLGASPQTLVQAGAEIGVGMVFVMVFVLLEQRAFEQTDRAERLLRDLQAANLELKAAQQREKDLAIAEERMRLARDIHDGLGHHLTVLSIQLQAADKLVERNPQAAAEAIRQSRSEAQAALEEVRRSVSMMRQSPAEGQPLTDLLAGVVGNFSAHTGLEAHFEPMGTPVELAPFAQHTLFRAVQESLTNVQKHARGVKAILVRLEYTSGSVHLLVRDDGKEQPASAAGSSGYGLKGLRERIDQLGGQLCCGPGPGGGFEVDVNIPLEEIVHDQSSSGG